MSGFFKAVGFLSFQKIVSIAVGIVRVKATAMLLGVAGVGLISQVSNLMNMAQQVILMGIGTGFLKQVAEAGGDRDWAKLNQTITAIILVIGTVGGLLLAVSVIAGRECSQLLFSSYDYALYVQFAIGSAICVALTQVCNKILQGLLRWKELALLNLVVAVVGAFATVGLTYAYRTTGAVVAIFFVSILALLLIGGWIYFRTSSSLDWAPACAKPAKAIWLELGKIGVVMSLGVVVGSGAIIFLRSRLIHSYGADANGYYQVAYALSRNYLMLLATTIYSYGIPQISSLKGDLVAIVAVQNRLLRLVLFVFVPGILLINCFRREVIILLYSKDFLLVQDYIWAQFIGDFLSIIRQTLSVAIIPLGFLRFYSFSVALSSFLWVGFGLYFLQNYSYAAIPLAGLGEAAITLVVSFIYQYKRIGYRVSKPNAALLVKSVIALVGGMTAGLWLSGWLAYIVPMVVVLLFLALGPSYSDWALVRQFVKNKLRSIGAVSRKS